MSIDSIPRGGDQKPLPQSRPEDGDEGGRAARDEENTRDALANGELDRPTGIARPPLGN